MFGMFTLCSGLTSLDLSSFNTSNVTEMNSMFSGCSGLTTLNVSNFNTTNVTYMSGMFQNCSGLTSLDLSGFNTANVTHIDWMFRGCSGLTSLELSNFDTSNAVDMSEMFRGCTGLTSLDLSSFNTSNVKYDANSYNYGIQSMFSGCSALTTIWVGDNWTTANLTESADVFTNCAALVGGAGTTYDANHTDYTYARIDGGPNSQMPGYFTYKEAPVVTDAEPYTVLSENNTVLTFYYDEHKEERNGMSVGPFENLGSNGVSTEWYGNRSTITTVVFDDSFANCTTLTSTAYWFYQLTKLTTIKGIQDLKTDNVNDINSMFFDCESLTSLDLSSLNLGNVTNMHQVFEGCTGLESIIFDGVNTENVTNMGDLFLNCSSLKTIDLSSFNTNKVTNMGYMFYRCTSLTTVYVSDSWTTASVTESNNMFERCYSIVGGKGTKFDENYIDATYARIDGGPNSQTPGYFIRSGDQPWVDPNVGDAEPYAVLSENNNWEWVLTFYYDDKKAERNGMDIGPFDSHESRGWNQQRESIINVVFDASFANCTTIVSTAFWFYECGHLTTIIGINNLKTDNVTDMTCMFDGCEELTELDLSGINTDKVTIMSGMFNRCSGLTSLDISGFNTANVTNMEGLFNRCSGLTSLDVSNFNTDNVKDMFNMFYGCSQLTSLDVSGFNTDYVTNMGNMFYGCSQLTSLDVSGFKTDNVTYMRLMFSDCSGLTSLDLSNFNTANVTNMEGLFNRCSGLTSLDVSGFKTDNVTYMRSMFYGCSNLTTIYAGEGWSTEAVTNGQNMFTDCTALVGGAGTHFSPDHTDYTYARIDGGPNSQMPGYFTYMDAPADIIVVDLIENGDMEGENNISYWYRNNQESTVPDTVAIANGVGVNGSRGIKIEATAKEKEMYDNQFWFRLNQPVSEGSRIRVSFDYRADKEAEVSVEAHAEPTVYINGFMFDEDHMTFTPEWQHYTYESEMFPEKSSDQQPMRSIAFTLNRLAEANNYYFDNVKFEVMLDWQCPKPTFTRNYNTVSIQSPFDAKIFYTTDGSEPNLHSAVYTEPLALTQATTIKAMAIVEGKDASPVATYAFEVMPEPYTVLSDNNTKVTFYYDKYRAEREGIALGTSDDWGDHVSEITTAVIDSSFVNYTSLTSTARWFNRLSNLKTITGLYRVKTDNVRDMEAMFAECSSLTDLDVTPFVTKNVKNMRYMFYNCSGMRRLDLTNFNTSKLTDMYRMFKGCFAMRVIFAGPDWTTEKVTSGEEVFNECTNIVGGETTTYSADHTDYTYARIDYRNNNNAPGYFTDKAEFERQMYELLKRHEDIKVYMAHIESKLYEKDPERKAQELWDYCAAAEAYIWEVEKLIQVAETSIDQMECLKRQEDIMMMLAELEWRIEEYQPGTPGEWHDGDEFTDITAEGITMTFRIISVAQNTCQVGPKPSNSWPHPVAIDNTITGHVTIPSKAQGFDVITIGEDAFNGCDITSVDIPNSITSIDASAFEYCTKLAKADLPANLKSIGAYAFYYCAFTSVVIPSSVRTMGEYYNRNPFTGCPNIQSITVEAGNEVFDSRENCNAIIEKASNTIFTGCGNTVIPRSAKAIADYAYYGCKGLTALMIPSNIESIASQSFAMCSNLATIQVELDNPVYDSRISCNAIVEKATNKLVLGCKNTFVPTSVTTIGEYAFNGSGISDINIPDNVKEIESHAFMSCEALSSVRLPSELTEIGMSVFYGCSSLKSIDIPETVTTIGFCAFQSSGLESIVIPSNVTTVDFQGFLDNSNLQSVTFGKNVSNFGHLAFYECDNIRTITSYIKTPPVATEAYFGSAVREQATLYVPYGTRERYLAMEGWNQFQNIVEMENTEPEPYGVLTGDNTTLRLYYDEQRDIRKGMLITPTMTREPWYEKRGSIMRVVVDETYASNITDETKFWLSDYPMLAAVQAGNAEIPAAQYRGIQNPNVLVYVDEDRLAPEGIQNVVVNGVAQEIVLKDASGNNNWYCPQAFQAEKISYTRNFNQQTRIGYSRGWESLALPFAVQTITHQDKGVIAPFGSDASEYHFWLRRLTHSGLQAVQTIEANTPYIISMPNSYEYPERFNLSGQVTFAAENVTVPQTVGVMDESAEFIMAPAFQNMTIQPDIYALNVGEKREYYAAGSVFERNYRDVRPFEAYTMHKGTSPAPMYFIIGENTDDNTTDILEVRSQVEDGNGEWYDLQGRKLGSTLNVQRSTLKKGVYIQNGRKVIVK